MKWWTPSADRPAGHASGIGRSLATAEGTVSVLGGGDKPGGAVMAAAYDVVGDAVDDVVNVVVAVDAATAVSDISTKGWVRPELIRSFSAAVAIRRVLHELNNNDP